MIGWLAGWFLLWRLRRLAALPEQASGSTTNAPAQDVASQGPVTIVIPARNEEQNLQRLLGDLQQARPAEARVVVVDDHSTDDTYALAARHSFVEVRRAPPLPQGWVGKSWACHVGAQDAAQGVLVFLDADVRIPGDGLRKALVTHQQVGGLVSVQPWHQVVRPYEQLSAPFNVLALMSTGAGQAWAPQHPSGVFGPVLITSVKDYARVGGHEAIRQQPVDDFALARAYKATGLATSVFGGQRDIQFRMYPQGVRGLLEGWTKNFAYGAMTMPIWRLALVGWWWFVSLACLTWYHGPFHLQTAILYPLFVAQMLVLYRRVGSFHPLTAVLYPIPHLLLGTVLGASLIRTFLFRSVRWRGRSVRYAVFGQAGERRPPPV